MDNYDNGLTSICFNCQKFTKEGVINGCVINHMTHEVEKYPTVDSSFKECPNLLKKEDPGKTYEDIKNENKSELNYINKHKDDEKKMHNYESHVDEIHTPDRPLLKPEKELTPEEYLNWRQSILEKITNRDPLYQAYYGMTQEELFNKMDEEREKSKDKDFHPKSNEDMLKGELMISHLSQVTSWKRVLNAARRTIGKEPIDKEPSTSWKAKMLLAEHSPIRLLEYDFGWKNIRQWVTTHLVRHHEGVEKFVHSQRGDRRELPCDRDHVYQGAKNDMDMTVNAQAIINISRKRLCNCASPETREAWKSFVEELAKEDSVLASKCVPECIYRGFCPEFLGSCGYWKTPKYKQRLAEYRRTKFGKDIKYYCINEGEGKLQVIVANTGHIYKLPKFGIFKTGEIPYEGILALKLEEFKYEINKYINGNELCITEPIIPISSLVIACFSTVPYYENSRIVEGKVNIMPKDEIITHIDGNIYNNDIDNLVTNCEHVI